MPHLENWSLAHEDPYLDPSLGHFCVYGKVFGHPNFPDGTTIKTSNVTELDSLEGMLITVTRTYTLGQICPQYSAWRESRGHGGGVFFKK